jgi:hypothetical protein
VDPTTRKEDGDMDPPRHCSGSNQHALTGVRVDLGQITAGLRGGTKPQGRGLLIEINGSRPGQAYDSSVLREETAP